MVVVKRFNVAPEGLRSTIVVVLLQMVSGGVALQAPKTGVPNATCSYRTASSGLVQVSHEMWTGVAEQASNLSVPGMDPDPNDSIHAGGGVNNDFDDFPFPGPPPLHHLFYHDSRVEEDAAVTQLARLIALGTALVWNFTTIPTLFLGTTPNLSAQFSRMPSIIQELFVLSAQFSRMSSIIQELFVDTWSHDQPPPSSFAHPPSSPPSSSSSSSSQPALPAQTMRLRGSGGLTHALTLALAHALALALALALAHALTHACALAGRRARW